MAEATIILSNMRGGCATVGDKVHTLFRVTNRGRRAPTASEVLKGRPVPVFSDDAKLPNPAALTVST